MGMAASMFGSARRCVISGLSSRVLRSELRSDLPRPRIQRFAAGPERVGPSAEDWGKAWAYGVPPAGEGQARHVEPVFQGFLGKLWVSLFFGSSCFLVWGSPVDRVQVSVLATGRSM